MYPYPRSLFSLFAKWIAHAAGHPLAFVLGRGDDRRLADERTAVGFSDTWQLVINILLDLEELTEADLERLRSRYESLGCIGVGNPPSHDLAEGELRRNSKR